MTELGIPFEEKLQVFSDDGNWDEFRKFSPTGLVPCLADGDTVVWESLAIVEYLGEKHAHLWPEDPSARSWARSATCEMHAGFSALRNRCSMTCGQRIKMHKPEEDDLRRDLDRLDELWGQGIEKFGGPFLAGDRFTAVDAFYCPVAFRVQSFGLKLNPISMDYVKKLLSLDAMQFWYEQALVEPWREIAHEEEIAKSGEVYADFRKPLTS